MRLATWNMRARLTRIWAKRGKTMAELLAISREADVLVLMAAAMVAIAAALSATAAA